MREVKNLEQLSKEFANIHSVVADSDAWLCKAFMFLIRNGFGQPRQKARRRHSPTKWQRFVGQKARQGVSLKQAAREWRLTKR